ncbi:hypothetical protein CPB83DRAFT_938985 [Crepidotus variabilis]|uniref:Uncharacterized protein n=1 Tax=Crepidotus variabilis TaxID=179855 RepID=A0A9P6EQV8_9AGAR|nr:hypothetical protein CPB83DRAFT_938985 [Crepidotus variabilis]
MFYPFYSFINNYIKQAPKMSASTSNDDSNQTLQRTLLAKMNQLMAATASKQGLDVHAIPTGLNRGTGTRDFTFRLSDIPGDDNTFKRAVEAISARWWRGMGSILESFDEGWDQLEDRMVINGVKPFANDPSAQYYLLPSKNTGVQTALRLYSGNLESVAYFNLDYVHFVPGQGLPKQTLEPIPQVIPSSHHLFIRDPNGDKEEVFPISIIAETGFSYATAEAKERRKLREGEDCYFVAEGLIYIHEREGE